MESHPLQPPDGESQERARDCALPAMLHNILEMALGFAAMARVFTAQSNQRILGRLCDFSLDLTRIHSADEFERRHKRFCERFCGEIRTAPKNLENGGLKASGPASFGHAAKVLDIALKVFVHYCALPSADVAQRLRPWLHGAIDTPILKHLKKQNRGSVLRAKSIAQIDEHTYRCLQKWLLKDMHDHY